MQALEVNAVSNQDHDKKKLFPNTCSPSKIVPLLLSGSQIVTPESLNVTGGSAAARSISSNDRRRSNKAHQGSNGSAPAGGSTAARGAGSGYHGDPYHRRNQHHQGGHPQPDLRDTLMECVQSADFDADNGEIEQQGSGLFEEERGENHPARPSGWHARASAGGEGGGASAVSEDARLVQGVSAAMAAAPATATMHLQQAAGAAISSATGAVAPGARIGRQGGGCASDDDDDDDGVHRSMTPGGGGSGIMGGQWPVASGSAAAAIALAALAASVPPQVAVSSMALGHNRGSFSGGPTASLSGIVPQVSLPRFCHLPRMHLFTWWTIHPSLTLRYLLSPVCIPPSGGRSHPSSTSHLLFLHHTCNLSCPHTGDRSAWCVPASGRIPFC